MERLDKHSYEGKIICLHKSTYKKRVRLSEFGATVTARITFCKRCGEGIKIVVEDIKISPIT